MVVPIATSSVSLVAAAASNLPSITLLSMSATRWRTSMKVWKKFCSARACQFFLRPMRCNHACKVVRTHDLNMTIKYLQALGAVRSSQQLMNKSAGVRGRFNNSCPPRSPINARNPKNVISSVERCFLPTTKITQS